MKETINKIKSYIIKNDEAKFIAIAILLLIASRLINSIPTDDFRNSPIILSYSFIIHTVIFLFKTLGMVLISLSIIIISVKALNYSIKVIIGSEWYIQIMPLAALLGFLFSFIVCSGMEGGIYSSSPLGSPYFITLFFIYSTSTWLFIYILAYCACVEDIIKDIKIKKTTLSIIKKAENFLLVFFTAMTMLITALTFFSLPYLNIMKEKIVIVPFFFLSYSLWMLISFAMLALIAEQKDDKSLPPQKKVKKTSHRGKNKINRSNRRKARL